MKTKKNYECPFTVEYPIFEYDFDVNDPFIWLFDTIDWFKSLHSYVKKFRPLDPHNFLDEMDSVIRPSDCEQYIKLIAC